jgi:hypothetical protein
MSNTRSQAAAGAAVPPVPPVPPVVDPNVNPNVAALTASNANNVAALTLSIQTLVSQLLAGGGDINAATTSIKEAIEASATANATAIGNLTASTAEVAANTKVSADQAVAKAKPVAIFSLHPGNHDASKALDYSTKHGSALYSAGTAALSGVPWDHTLGNTLGLSNRLGMRAAKSGWSTPGGDILTIQDSSGVNRQLIKEYGLLTIADIEAHFAQHKSKAGRQLQNSAQLCECLFASLAPDTAEIAMSESHLFTSQGIQSGELLFKFLMNKAIIDNKQTTEKLRGQWENMPSKMGDLKSDIDKFVLCYRNVTAMLKARGKEITESDEITALFKAFGCVEDAVFVDYMDRKKEAHEEDDASPLTVDKLIKMAQNKFNDRTQADNNVWGTASKQVQEIVALKSEITKMKGGLNLIPTIFKKQFKANNNSNGGGGNDNGKQGKKRIVNAAKNKVTAELLAIKRKPPKEGEKQTRVFGKKDHAGFGIDKTYHWCPHHLMWCVHTPEQCTKGSGQAEKQKTFKKKKGHGKGGEQAYAALIDMFNGMDSDDDESE